ncbi:NADH dehydrogenase [ubiquinone] 1 beta subcomplex subunit 1 [Halyomorpha halys]|uniref:NADH dehydrogenase [ubiquinone] 1 beta subcomplex subunit 1 n=1 Tax=Halyomorpha halys TaxID=286706 RepID=UPI000D0C78B4|nr:uncharacterized protein LOC106682933 [Halyomorpha halys]XP_024220094.1 uncharacterized protein LOC106682933 [Halyomorpha halys]XP_024220095.1 uncharacterized protein LOC106682933 [Halyomorpha halys]XP_024220096.1 uncharacterized protein LOC106682933 [Halyomorpha halys]
MSLSIYKQYWLVVFPLTGFLIGKYIDDFESSRMVRFRDKSALYGRVLAPGEKPSWP